jgi:hypothetical protein
MKNFIIAIIDVLIIGFVFFVLLSNHREKQKKIKDANQKRISGKVELINKRVNIIQLTLKPEILRTSKRIIIDCLTAIKNNKYSLKSDLKKYNDGFMIEVSEMINERINEIANRIFSEYKEGVLTKRKARNVLIEMNNDLDPCVLNFDLIDSTIKSYIEELK